MKYDPKIILARFTSKCHETGKEIKKGARCLYHPLEKKVYSVTSEMYEDHIYFIQIQAQRSGQYYFDTQYLGDNY